MFLALFVIVAALIIVLAFVKKAPVGYQDATGFHYGLQTSSSQLTTNLRGNNMLLTCLLEELKPLPVDHLEFRILKVTECYNFTQKGADLEIQIEHVSFRDWIPTKVLYKDSDSNIWVPNWFANSHKHLMRG